MVWNDNWVNKIIVSHTDVDHSILTTVLLFSIIWLLCYWFFSRNSLKTGSNHLLQKNAIKLLLQASPQGIIQREDDTHLLT